MSADLALDDRAFRTTSENPPDAQIVRVPVFVLHSADSPRLNGIDHNHVRTLAEGFRRSPQIAGQRASSMECTGSPPPVRPAAKAWTFSSSTAVMPTHSCSLSTPT
ncbi:hypothetical protein ACWEIJ_15030 [Lentzea sp. NPDC004789]